MQEMKASEVGQVTTGSSEDKRPWRWELSETSGVLCLCLGGSSLTVLPGSQEKLEIWGFVRNVSNTGKAKQNLYGWKWHPAHQPAHSALHHENTNPEMISLIKGQVGTQTEL